MFLIKIKKRLYFFIPSPFKSIKFHQSIVSLLEAFFYFIGYFWQICLDLKTFRKSVLSLGKSLNSNMNT